MSDAKNNELINIASKISEDDFMDLVFDITECNDKRDSFEITAKGSYEDRIVGFNVDITKDLKKSFEDGEIISDVFVKDGACFKSIGEESDNFVQALAKLYKVSNQADIKFSEKPLCFTIICLTENEVDLNNNYEKNKIFFDEENKLSLYAEIYLNLDLKNKKIELFEKDSEYRENIVKIFSLK